MSSQTILWTALPRLAQPSRNKLQLSVHVAPRLDTGGGDGVLGSFPDFLDWPAKLAQVQLQVVFGDGSVRVPTRVTVPAAGSTYWTSLFDAKTRVEGRKVQIPLGPIVSYPTGRVNDWVKGRYSQLIQQSPTAEPALSTVVAMLGDVAFSADKDGGKAKGARLAAIDGARDTGFTDPATGLTVKASRFSANGAPAGDDLLAVERFYTRAAFDEKAPIAPPDPDFHQLLSVAGGHPALLRLLGVVIDLEIDGFRDSSGAPDRVKIVPAWESALGSASKDSTPWTRCSIGTQTFLPTPLDPNEISRGQLRLGDPSRFSIVQIDVDGTALKTLGTAQAALRSSTNGSDDTPDTATVPALRTGGIEVARVDHAAQLGKAFARMAAHVEPVLSRAQVATGPEHDLWAEDVTRGYYIDIWDDVSQQWRSLTQRVGTYDFLDLGEKVAVPEGDEAAMTVAPVQDAGAQPGDEMYLGEGLFRWQGWSLAAAQPGMLVDNLDAIDDGKPKGTPPYPVAIDLRAAPRSLPRLRFGREYRVRMRAADLAGNSVPLALAADPADDNLVARIDFRRFEPVQSPDVVMRHGRTEGESVERLVIRSNYAKPPLAPEDRQVFPARTWQRHAEQHGLFDVPPGQQGAIDKTWYKRIADREAVSLASLGQLDPLDPVVGADSANPGAEGSYFIPQAFDVVPYLPDPLSVGAALDRLPGSDVTTFVDFRPKAGAAWPDYRPFILRVVEPGNNPTQPGLPPKLDELPDGTRILTVQLPKAEVTQVKLSSTLDIDDLERLGLWDWAGGHVNPTDAREGRVWLLTPSRMLTLVHAVRQPLATPEFVALASLRHYGDTFATISDRMTFNRKSTAKVELLATWTEPVDNGPGTPDPVYVGTSRALAVTVPAAEQGNATILSVQHPHEFHDTKHRQITYTGVATTRFSEYFVERTTATVPAFTQDGTFTVTLDDPGDPDQLGELPGVVPGATRVRRVDTGELLEEADPDDFANGEGDFWVDEPAQLLTVRQAAVTPGEQLEISWIEESITRESLAPRTISIPSSARPAAPEVLYIVPTFQWQQTATTSKRIGGGLRVYLDRPWYSSGDGELLGVVLWPGSPFAADPPQTLQGRVSEWGVDPLSLGAGVPDRHLKLKHFPLSGKAMRATGLAIDESPAKVDVAGHAVLLADPHDPSVISNFDSERGLYYCDIDIDQGTAYWPFVRLALARYQPQSLDGVELSRVVLADYAQLAPDRSLSVVPMANVLGQPTFRVTLTGPNSIQNAGRWGYGGARVLLEKRNAGKPTTSDIAWGQSGPPIAMTAGGGSLTNQIWTATVTLPGPLQPNLYRLVVEQYEQFDQGSGTYAIGSLGERILHQDVFPLGTPHLGNLG